MRITRLSGFEIARGCSLSDASYEQNLIISVWGANMRVTMAKSKYYIIVPENLY